MDPQPSWKALIAALRTPAVNYPALASEIEQKHSSRATGIHVQFVSCHPSPNSVTEPDHTDTEGVQFLSHRPTPKPRRQRSIIMLTEGWKYKLTQSFEDVTYSQVSQGQIEKAEQCIKHGGTHNERYQLIEFDKLLNENQVTEEGWRVHIGVNHSLLVTY